MDNLVIATGSAHRKRITKASARCMAGEAVHAACRKVRKAGGSPLSAVDTISVHSFGPWIEEFAIGLTDAALQEGISICGGEMAQMPDTFGKGAGSVVVTCVGLRQ